MNTKLCKGVMFIIPLCFMFFLASSYGQGNPSATLQILQAQVQQNKELVANWEACANVEFFLSMLVVFLGAVVALLQKVDGKKWCPYVVAVIGIVISVLTYATKEYFEVDQKTYRRSAEMAKIEISTAETYLALVAKLDTDPQNKKDLLEKVVTSIHNIQSIAENIEKASPAVASSTNGPSFELIRTAHAQVPLRPAWISQTMTENSTSFRFVGKGAAPSVSAAQSQALLEAQNAAAYGLSVPLDTVRRFALLINTYFEYDAGQRTYLCYARIELNKAFVRR